MQQNLSDLFKNTQQHNVFLMHNAEEYAPFTEFAKTFLQKPFESTVKYQFHVDRFFKFTELSTILDNASLFAEKNLIELYFKTKPTANQENDLLSLIKHIDDNSYLFIFTDKLSALSSAWIKEVDSRGVVVAIKEIDTVSVIKKILEEHNLQIEQAALNQLLELHTGNPAELMQEITRLSLFYPPNHKISHQDIQKTDNSQYNIYQLSGAYLAADLAKSIAVLDNLYTEPADAILITWVINEDLKKLLKLKAMLKKGISVSSAITQLKVRFDTAKYLQDAEKRLSYASLLEIQDLLANLDLVVKGLKKSDPKVILSKIIKLLCSA